MSIYQFVVDGMLNKFEVTSMYTKTCKETKDFLEAEAIVVKQGPEAWQEFACDGSFQVYTLQ